jgi:phosphopantothenoylcysteine decarboxylase/phosphopantothenate--cysteine ligase
MGYAIARAARDAGARVTLISATVSLPAPDGMKIIRIESVIEMKETVMEAVKGADVLIMAAAPADYVVKNIAPQKIKKGKENLTLELVRAPDIISGVTGNIVKVGFSAETENLLDNAKEKRLKKGMDLIVANDVTAPGAGFGVDTIRYT